MGKYSAVTIVIKIQDEYSEVPYLMVLYALNVHLGMSNGLRFPGPALPPAWG